MLNVRGHEARKEAQTYTVGLSLGHQYLQSAYYDDLGKFHLITEIPSSEEWQDYFIKTMEDRRNHVPYDDPGNLALSEATIASIVVATIHTLEFLSTKPTIQIRSIVVPQQFDDMSSKVNIMRIAQAKGYIQHASQVITKFNSARLAYGLDNCAGYGLPNDCDVDDDEHFVFIIDLGRTYLSLGLSICGYLLYAPIKTRHWTHFMEQNGTALTDTSSALPPFTSTMVKDFLAEVLEELGNDIPDVISHLSGIILTSEASTDLSNVMIDIIRNSFTTLSTTFKISKSPTMVAVEGGAYRARQAVTDPYYLDPAHNEDHEHVEEAPKESDQVFHKDL